jgi:hypothetical protein
MAHGVRSPVAVNRSRIPANSLLAGKKFEDWRIGDPFGKAIELHGSFCDDIERKAKELAARWRAEQPKP